MHHFNTKLTLSNQLIRRNIFETGKNEINNNITMHDQMIDHMEKILENCSSDFFTFHSTLQLE